MPPSSVEPAPLQGVAPRPLALLRPRWRGALVLLSFALCALAPLLSPSTFGDLSWNYTDHLRHAHNAWLFLHRGLDVYRESFASVAEGVPYRHPMLMWPWAPYAYPPLVLLLFSPLALAVQYLPLSEPALGRLGILYMLVLAHLALWAMLRTVGRLSVVKGALVLLGWVMVVRAALQGFYDPLWLACGALMVHRLAQRRPDAALGWFALAALLSYRAVVLGPLALAALVQGVRGRPVRAWPWAPAGLALAAGLVCIALFSFTLPYTWAFRDGPHLLERGGTPLAYVLLTGLAVTLVVARGADLVVAATVVLVTGFALVDTAQWWHALVLLPAPLAVGAWRPARWPQLSVVALLAWAFVLHKHAWTEPPSRLLREVSELAQHMQDRDASWRPGTWFSADASLWVPPGWQPRPSTQAATEWLWAAGSRPAPLRIGRPTDLLRLPPAPPEPWSTPTTTTLALREPERARRGMRRR